MRDSGLLMQINSRYLLFRREYESPKERIELTRVESLLKDL